MGIEKYLTGYRIQQVSAEGDNSQNSDDWSTVASGKTAEEALTNLNFNS